MKDVLYLAWRYLAYHRFKTAVLAASIATILYLPAGLNLLVDRGARQLTARAESTPLLVGAKGSPLELVLRGLYFESDVPPAMRHDQWKRLTRELAGLQAPAGAMAIPLHLEYRTQHAPIVGTSLEYFDYRGLRIAEGRQMTMLGECVLGHTAARLAAAGPGGSVISSPQSVFDLAAAYPLKMRVAGVLAPTGTADDRAVFVDVKTAWVIAGLAHGHQDLGGPEAAGGVLRREGKRIIANRSVVEYNEITPDNIASFHFHGDPNDFPLTAAIVLPGDRRTGALLQGQYVGPDEVVQMVEPPRVIRELLATVLSVRRYLLIAMAVLAAATLATISLVFLLSLQLRRNEIATIYKIGGSRRRVAALLAAEVLSVIVAGGVVAAALTLATAWAAASVSRWLVQLA